MEDEDNQPVLEQRMSSLMDQDEEVSRENSLFASQPSDRGATLADFGERETAAESSR